MRFECEQTPFPVADPRAFIKMDSFAFKNEDGKPFDTLHLIETLSKINNWNFHEMVDQETKLFLAELKREDGPNSPDKVWDSWGQSEETLDNIFERT